MGFLDLTMTVQTEIQQKNDIECQITSNTAEKNLKQRQSSAKIDEINHYYTQELALIKAAMNDIEDKTDAEYEKLMAEYKELQTQRDVALTQAESEATDYETVITVENDMLQAQLEAITADLEAFKSARDEDVQASAGYFQ